MAYARKSAAVDCLRSLAVALFLLAAAACSVEPRRPVSAPEERAAPLGVAETATDRTLRESAVRGDSLSPPARAARTAASLVGSPYRYGGSGPDAFDCSGLVWYAYAQAGVRVPRTSVEQFRATRPVPLAAARPGDLLFFRLRNKVSHVGIYLGNSEFVHAPSHGGSVEVESLGNRYFERHLVRAGRLDP
jgi:cell wall-associated NlpC family hydrolase